MNTNLHTVLLQSPRGTVVTVCHPPLQASRTLAVVAGLPLLAVALFLIFTVAIFLAGGRDRMRYEAFKQSMREVTVVVSLPRPPLNQETVDFAMALFSIDKESFVSGPEFDASLADRGLTVGATLDAHKAVLVGPAAFSSWGVLGSTLGHEIEIHCRQSFASILLLDKFTGLMRSARRLLRANEALAMLQQKEVAEPLGTSRAERTAYQYEMNSRGRFGLSEDEVKSIQQVMDYYYPEQNPGVD